MNLADQAIAAYQQLVANQVREAEVRAAEEVATITKACKRECVRVFNREPDNVVNMDGVWCATVEGIPFIYNTRKYDRYSSDYLYLHLGLCEKCGQNMTAPIHSIEDLGKVLLEADNSKYHLCQIPCTAKVNEPEPPSVEQLVIQSLTLLIQQVIDGE